MLSFLLLVALAGDWSPGLIETKTYKHAESAIPGNSVYSFRGVLWQGQKAFEVEVVTQRTLVLGGQQGRLETRSFTLIDAATSDLIFSRLVTTLNGAEASYLRAERKGKVIEVWQRLRGSGGETRRVDAPGPVIEESAQMFYVERLPLKRGAAFSWDRFSASQSRLTPTQAVVEEADKEYWKVELKTDIGPAAYFVRRGPVPAVTRTEAAGAPQMTLENPPR